MGQSSTTSHAHLLWCKGGGASQELCAHHWEGNDVKQLMGVPQSLVKQLLYWVIGVGVAYRACGCGLQLGCLMIAWTCPLATVPGTCCLGYLHLKTVQAIFMWNRPHPHRSMHVSLIALTLLNKKTIQGQNIQAV